MGNTPNIRFKGFTDDWEQREFSEGVSEIGDGLHGTPIYCEDGNVYFINGNNLVDGKIVISAETKKVNESQQSTADKSLDDTTILMSINGTIGKLAYYSGERLMLGKSAAYIKVSEFDKRFVYAYLQAPSVQGYFMDSLTGTTIKNLGLKAIREMIMFIPQDVDEQKRIGKFLDYLDHLITLHQRKCDETKKLKKYMLQKMFPQKDEKKPEIRFAGFTDDWEQRKLGDIITEYKETVDSDCTLPILTSSKTEGVILQEEHFGRKQQHDITGYNILPRNYCTYRNRSDGVDFTFNINKCCDKGIISKFYPVFSGKNSDVFFLSLVLNNSEEVVREIAYTCTGTGQKVLSFLDLQKMKVRVPNFDEQKEIAAYFESLDHIITLHQRKCDEIKEVKKFMLQNMFPQKG